MMKQKLVIVSIIIAVFLLAGYFIVQNGSISSYPHFFQGMAIGIFSLTIIIWIIAFITNVFRKSGGNNNKKQLIPKNQLILSAGMICVFTGFLMAMHSKENAIILYVSTIIIILSTIFNIVYIRRIRSSFFE